MTATSTEQTFLLPDLGEGLTEAEVVRWLVAEGDVVVVDQSVVEVETAKSLVEVPSPYAGRIVTLHAAEGEIRDVGTPLITVAAEDAAPAAPPSTSADTYREEEKQAGSGNVLIGYGTSGTGGPSRRRRPRRRPTAPTVPAQAPLAKGPDRGLEVPRVMSPLVRRLARDGGIDLAEVQPTGEGSVITRADVVCALAARMDDHPRAPSASLAASAQVPGAPQPPSAGERRTPLTRFRKAVATALSRSRSEIPEATVWVDVDATALWELREAARTPLDPGPGLLAYIARFVVAGLNEYPVLNARFDSERQEIVELDRINLGLAVHSERGLVVPAVIGAETMTTTQLDTAIREVTARAREGRATAEELAAGTFTLNNYGSFRVDGSAAIIHHPQVAILGFGRIIDRPWVVEGEIVPRKITQMSFVFDHRVCDGGTAAGFMRVVADAIESPSSAIARL
jgi:pyruvate dehydrogenase E2 component (dihydrolipoamide acetyltransferase)